MAFVVAEPCVGCKRSRCVAVCPCDCFREGEEMLYIHAPDYIELRHAAGVPVEAIFLDVELPAKWALCGRGTPSGR